MPWWFSRQGLLDPCLPFFRISPLERWFAAAGPPSGLWLSPPGLFCAVRLSEAWPESFDSASTVWGWSGWCCSVAPSWHPPAG